MRWSPICGGAFGSSTPTFSRKRREQGCLTCCSRHTRFLRLIFARDATIWSRRSACSSSVRDQRRKRLERGLLLHRERQRFREPDQIDLASAARLFEDVNEVALHGADGNAEQAEIASRVCPSQMSSKMRISAGVRS